MSRNSSIVVFRSLYVFSIGVVDCIEHLDHLSLERKIHAAVKGETKSPGKGVG